LKFFMCNFLDNPDNTNFWEYNRHTLYMLKNGNYLDLKEMFIKIQEDHVRLARGSNQKSHVVSPIDLRLSCYLMLLFNLNFSKLWKENSFHLIDKSRYLPTNK
jgi:hypothetical protein